MYYAMFYIFMPCFIYLCHDLYIYFNTCCITIQFPIVVVLSLILGCINTNLRCINTTKLCCIITKNRVLKVFCQHNGINFFFYF